jgi:hypothetical protein
MPDIKVRLNQRNPQMRKHRRLMFDDPRINLVVERRQDRHIPDCTHR